MIYLVNPNEKRILENAGDRMPIGLLSIAASLEERGEEVKVYDLNHVPMDRFWADFHTERPEAVGISVYTSPIYREAIDLAKNMEGHTKRIAGGHHATAMPESLIKNFELVVMGEGEDLDINKLGIVTGKEQDLKQVPNLAYHLINFDDYQMKMDGKRTSTIITSRGCPFGCVYCGKLSDKVRHEPVRKVRDQINELERHFDAHYFLDDVFTLNGRRMKEIAGLSSVPFRATTRANLLNMDKMTALAEEGIELLSIGIESGDDDILRKSQKYSTVDQSYKAISMAKLFNIKTKGFFIIGLPGETEKTARKTIDFSKRLRSTGLTKADFYFLTPFPGTAIWKDPSKLGIEITDKDYTKYLEAGKGAKCYVNTEGLKAERIEELVNEAQEWWKN